MDTMNTTERNSTEQTSEVSSRHLRMIESLVLDGLKPSEVCALYDITESRLSILRRSPLWVKQEAAIRKQHIENYQYKLHKLLPAAIAALEDGVQREFAYEAIDGTNKTVVNDTNERRLAAEAVLDRSGLPKGGQPQTNIQPTINLYVPPAWGKDEGTNGKG